jgi:hypothetical protein
MLRVMFFIVMLSVNRLIEQCKDGCLRGAMTFRTITFNVMTLSIAIKTCHSALQDAECCVFIGMLSAVILTVDLLNVVLPNVITLIVVAPPAYQKK